MEVTPGSVQITSLDNFSHVFKASGKIYSKYSVSPDTSWQDPAGPQQTLSISLEGRFCQNLPEKHHPDSGTDCRSNRVFGSHQLQNDFVRL